MCTVYVSVLRNVINELKSGKSFNITKYSNRLHTVIAYPMASGLPFFHSYSIPTVMYLGGKAQVTISPDAVNNNNQLTINTGLEMM